MDHGLKTPRFLHRSAVIALKQNTDQGWQHAKRVDRPLESPKFDSALSKLSPSVGNTLEGNAGKKNGWECRHKPALRACRKPEKPCQKPKAIKGRGTHKRAADHPAPSGGVVQILPNGGIHFSSHIPQASQAFSAEKNTAGKNQASREKQKKNVPRKSANHQQKSRHGSLQKQRPTA